MPVLTRGTAQDRAKRGYFSPIDPWAIAHRGVWISLRRPIVAPACPPAIQVEPRYPVISVSALSVAIMARSIEHPLLTVGTIDPSMTVESPDPSISITCCEGVSCL